MKNSTKIFRRKWPNDRSTCDTQQLSPHPFPLTTNNMPKAKRSTNLSRVARRQMANSENLPSPATRKIAEVETSGSVELKDPKANTTTNAIANDNKSATDTPNTEQLSRGQRKRQAKREQFLRKEKMILSSLMLQRQEEQKKRIDGLDAIKQALMDATGQDSNKNSSEVKPAQHVTTNKAKRKLVAKEIEHVNLILQHPSFKANPLETMQEHLRNTLAEDRKQHEMKSKKRTEQEKQKTESKRAEKNAVKRKSQKKKYKPRRTR